MAITPSYLPTVATAGSKVELSAANLVGTTATWELSAVPSDSALTVGNIAVPSFVPDVPGVYTLTARDWNVNRTPAKYDGDPGAANTRALVASATLSVNVMKCVKRTLGASPNSCTLTMLCSGSTIVGAMLSEATSPVALMATRDGAVRTKLATLANVAPASVEATLVAKANFLVGDYKTHSQSTTYHNAADTDNALRLTGTVASAQEAIAALNEVRLQLYKHLRSVLEGEFAKDVHVGIADPQNVILAPQATDFKSACVLANDLKRVLDAHRAIGGGSNNVHKVVDATTVRDFGYAASLEIAFVNACRGGAVTVAPIAEQASVQTLIGERGFDA